MYSKDIAKGNTPNDKTLELNTSAGTDKKKILENGLGKPATKCDKLRNTKQGTLARYLKTEYNHQGLKAQDLTRLLEDKPSSICERHVTLQKHLVKRT